MTKIRIFLLISALLAGAAVAGAQGHRHGGIVISEVNAEQVLTASRLHDQVEFLSHPSVGGRSTATPGSQRIKWWLAASFRAQGLVPLGDSWFHPFRTVSGRVGHNVAGILPGSGSNRKYVIVMAHFDNLGTLDGTFYPGADANASGVAAMLAVSEMFARMKEVGKSYSKSLIFVGLDAKEQGLGGARALWDSIREGRLTDPSTGSPIGRDDISMVVNLDQLGSTDAPVHRGRPDYLIMLSDPSDGNRSTLVAANRGTGLDLGFDYYGSRDFTNLFYRSISDQRPFLEAGVPAVMFTSGITMNTNKPYDKCSTLDFDVLRSRVLVIFKYIAKLL